MFTLIRVLKEQLQIHTSCWATIKCIHSAHSREFPKQSLQEEDLSISINCVNH